MTRRLIAAGQRPVTVGMFFSLGHSTSVYTPSLRIFQVTLTLTQKSYYRIVVLTSIAVAATAASFSDRFDSFERIGGIIGTSVSAAFLLILALMNTWILYKLIKEMKQLIAMGDQQEEDGGVDTWGIQGAGCLMNVFKGAFRMIDRPWKMYPLGVLCEFRFLPLTYGWLTGR